MSELYFAGEIFGATKGDNFIFNEKASVPIVTRSVLHNTC